MNKQEESKLNSSNIRTIKKQYVTEEQLKKINQYTRRELSNEEVFVFTVILCDNEVDRDCERFTHSALQKLGELFMGKTGVFDHAARAENQSARIFDTQLVYEEKQTSLGEPYCCLKAWAYMVRCEKNADLILEIDAGIKKEVSVGCAVAEITCSICAAGQREQGCVHQKGESYNGVLCHHILNQPTDAYEWSFVAVPAQKNAGVTKRMGAAVSSVFIGQLSKLFDTKQDVQLTQAEIQTLAKQYEALEKLAQTGREHLVEKRREVVRLVRLVQPELDANVLEEVTEQMDMRQLHAFEKAFSKSVSKQYPVRPQIGRTKLERTENRDASFKI